MPVTKSVQFAYASPFGAILFDMDGVILDSEPVHERALQAALKIYGIIIPHSASKLFRGLTERKVCRMVVERWSDGQVDVETLMAAKYAAYAEMASQVKLMPGIMQLIAYIHQEGWPLGLVTSAAKHDQVRAFRMFGLGKYFPVVVTAADITHPKPHPQPYLFAASRMRTNPENCLVIEDSKYGVASAAAAGCTVIGYATGVGGDKLKQAGAHLTFQHAAEIERHLRNLLESARESG